MQLLPIRPAPYTKLAMFIPLRVELLVYTAWATVPTTARFCTGHKAGNSCSATRRFGDVYHLASTLFHGVLHPVKYVVVLQAVWG